MFPQASPMCQAQYWDLELLLSLGPSRSPLWRDRCDPTGQHLPKFSQIRILICIWRFFVVLVQSLSHVQLFAASWITAYHAGLSFTLSQRLLKLMCIVSLMPSNHLILCHPLLFLPSVFPSIKVLSNELAVLIRWPKYCNFSISPSKEY